MTNIYILNAKAIRILCYFGCSSRRCILPIDTISVWDTHSAYRTHAFAVGHVLAQLALNRLFSKHAYFCFSLFFIEWLATNAHWMFRHDLLEASTCDTMNMEQFIQNNDANYCSHSCEAATKYPLMSSPNGNKKWKVVHCSCRLTQQWKNGIFYAILPVWLTDGGVMAHRNWCTWNHAIALNGIQKRS